MRTCHSPLELSEESGLREIISTYASVNHKNFNHVAVTILFYYLLFYYFIFAVGILLNFYDYLHNNLTISKNVFT